MSYQQFSNVPVVAGTATASTVTATAHPGQQPAVIVANDQSMSLFAPKAQATRNLGIALLVIGIIVFLLGVIMIFASPYYWLSYSGNGIWCGVFIIISGSLCISAGMSPEKYATRCAALTFCIITICLAVAAGIMAYVGFIDLVTCSSSCYWSNYENQMVCSSYCNNRGSAAPVLSGFLSLLMSAVFILSLIAAVFTGKGCCGQRYNTGYIIQGQPGGQQTFIATSNYQSTQGYAQQQYAAPPYSQQQYSQQQPYNCGAPPPQQYSQAPMATQAGGGQGGVTYGADYAPQKNSMPVGNAEAPPLYAPN